MDDPQLDRMLSGVGVFVLSQDTILTGSRTGLFSWRQESFLQQFRQYMARAVYP